MDAPPSRTKKDKVQYAIVDEENKPSLVRLQLDMMRHNCICDDSQDIYGRNVGLPVEDFIKQHVQDGVDGLESDFDLLDAEDVVPCKPYYKFDDKNRYSDIYCIENGRVILKESSSYIHANFVHGYKHNNAFICTQAPMDNTTNDFWKMVWQEKCFIIVSLTRIIEGGCDKCYKYWPSIQYKVKKYGKLQVSNLDVDSRCEYYDITFLKMVDTRTKEVRCVYHFLYLGWPDFGVPSSSITFHKFSEEIHKCAVAHQKEIRWWNGCPEGPPIVVHCSAGVGRTGTFCALSILKRKILDTGKIDLLHCVRALRKQRAHSVQKPSQYAFIFLALIEFASVQNLISLDDLPIDKFVKEFARYNKGKVHSLKMIPSVPTKLNSKQIA